LRTLFLSAVFAAAAGSALAQSQPYEQVEAPKTWRVEVGGGVTHGFSATGNTGEDVNYTAWGSANYKDVIYANGLDGLGWNAIKTDDFRAGVQLRPRFAAGDIEGSAWTAPTWAPTRPSTPTSGSAGSWSAAASPRTFRT